MEDGAQDLKELKYRCRNQVGAPGGKKCTYCLSICFLATKDNPFKQQEANLRGEISFLQVHSLQCVVYVESKRSKSGRNHDDDDEHCASDKRCQGMHFGQ